MRLSAYEAFSMVAEEPAKGMTEAEKRLLDAALALGRQGYWGAYSHEMQELFDAAIAVEKERGHGGS